MNTRASQVWTRRIFVEGEQTRCDDLCKVSGRLRRSLNPSDSVCCACGSIRHPRPSRRAQPLRSPIELDGEVLGNLVAVAELNDQVDLPSGCHSERWGLAAPSAPPLHGRCKLLSPSAAAAAAVAAAYLELDFEGADGDRRAREEPREHHVDVDWQPAAGVAVHQLQ